MLDRTEECRTGHKDVGQDRFDEVVGQGGWCKKGLGTQKFHVKTKVVKYTYSS